jgi:hypothetical protein
MRLAISFIVAGSLIVAGGALFLGDRLFMPAIFVGAMLIASGVAGLIDWREYRRPK